MSKNMVAKSPEECPQCGAEMNLISGPAKEWVRGEEIEFTLKVLRCVKCNTAEVLEKLDTNKALMELLQRDRGPLSPPSASKSSGILGLGCDHRFPLADDLGDDFFPR